MKNLDHIKLQAAEAGPQLQPVNQQALVALRTIASGQLPDGDGVPIPVVMFAEEAIAAAEQQTYGFALYDCQRQMVQGIAAAPQASVAVPDAIKALSDLLVSYERMKDGGRPNDAAERQARVMLAAAQKDPRQAFAEYHLGKPFTAAQKGGA